MPIPIVVLSWCCTHPVGILFLQRPKCKMPHERMKWNAEHKHSTPFGELITKVDSVVLDE
jgi:hypothetical protein